MATPYHLPKKRGALKSTQISFLIGTPNFGGLSQWRLCWGCQVLRFVLDLSDQMCTPFLHGLAWYCCLFVYLWLMRCCTIFWCMIICCLFCLLKSFPNYHVCVIQTNMYAPLFNNFVVVVTIDHRSLLDSSTQWRTHQLIA